jgi:hypothetical protein
MTRRATFTQAELTRAIRAASAAGKVALQTAGGIAFVDPGFVPQTAAKEPDTESAVEKWFRQNDDDQD